MKGKTHLRKVRFAAEFALARSILLWVRLLPPEALQPLARGLAEILFRVIGGRRRVVGNNLELAFGRRDMPDPDRVARASLTGLVLSFLDLACLPARAEAMRRRLVFRDPGDRVRLDAMLREGPIIIAASHFGAYEAAGVAAPLVGVPVTSLVRPLDNPLLEDWLHSVRTRFGQRIASNRGGLRDLFRALELGRSVVVLVDLNHRPRNRLFVSYFGVRAATAPTAALLALRTGRPLVNVFVRRVPGRGAFSVELGPRLDVRRDLPQREAMRLLLQQATDQVEIRVREEPEQWLWTHRRWKTRPSEEDR